MNADDLKQFCGDESRKNIATPFSIGDFTYATNGHVMIRVPLLSDIPERINAPAADEIIGKYIGSEYEPIPDILPLKKKTCPECEGTGKFQTCPECDGDGLVTFENDYNEYDFTCETCNGQGKFKEGNELDCERCGGTGKIIERECVTVAGRFYDKAYILMLKKLPDCRISFASELNPGHFTFKDGDGLIMPVKYF